MKLHTEEKSFKCPVAGCTAAYHRQCDLKNHIAAVHEKVGEEGELGMEVSLPLCRRAVSGFGLVELS